MRVYYDDLTDEILFLEDFRLGENGKDEPSPGTYIEAPPVDYSLYNKEDYLIVDGSFVKKDQAIIDQRVADKQAVIDNQIAINEAQQKVIDRLAETMDKLLAFTASVHPLTAPQQQFVDDFRNDYADYTTKRDA